MINCDCIEIARFKSDAVPIRAEKEWTHLTHKVIHRICGNYFAALGPVPGGCFSHSDQVIRRIAPKAL
jgi:hypothetical protein